jgi:hypothetical protein
LLGLLYIFGIRSRRTFLTVFLTFLLLPFLVVALLYIFRTPIQQGKVLVDMGPLLSLVFPADDLYLPLTTIEVTSDQTEYEIKFSHRYVGRHVVEISSPEGSGYERDQQNFRVILEVFQGGKVVYRAGPSKGSRFWGKEDYGLHFNTYQVPKDLPVRTELTARVTITGDIGAYLAKHGEAFLSITKMSDE